MGDISILDLRGHYHFGMTDSVQNSVQKNNFRRKYSARWGIARGSISSALPLHSEHRLRRAQDKNRKQFSLYSAGIAVINQNNLEARRCWRIINEVLTDHLQGKDIWKF